MSAYLKDILKEVRKSAGRFLSLLIITALGAASLVGILATSLDMQDFADKSYKDHNLYDVQVESTTGFTNADIAALRNTVGVHMVMPGYVYDFYLYKNNSTSIVRTHSLPSDLNQIDVTQGRLPQNDKECAVQGKLLADGDYKLGDTITLGLDNMDDFYNVLASNTFTIVGVVSSPLYINASVFGNTALGDGSVGYFVYLSPQAYKLGVYTDAYLLMDGSHDMNNLSQVYFDAANGWVKQIETTGDTQVQAEKSQLSAQQKQVTDSLASLSGAQAKIDDSRKLLQANLSRLKALDPRGVSPATRTQTAQLQASLAQLDDQQAQLTANLSKLDATQKQLDAAPTPQWFYFTRQAGLSYDSYYQDSLRIQRLGYVFPTVFLLVAILVSLTTMSRMVEENRTQIGVYKALGYGPFRIVMKYVIYAFTPGVIGGIIGVVTGSAIFPPAILSSYRSLYILPPLHTVVPVALSVVTIAAAVGVVLLVTLITCIGAMSGVPADLMRPKAPPGGKRVLIERLPFVWARLSFTGKVTARNIFRYKKRFVMALVGVASASALMVTGFGLRDSIGGVDAMQYGQVIEYASQVYTKDIATPGQRSGLDSVLAGIPGDYLYIHQETVQVPHGGSNISPILIVPETPDKLTDFINLRSPKTGEAMPLAAGGVLLTEKFASELGVSAGGTFSMTTNDDKAHSVKVTGVVENYVVDYIYMAPDVYQTLVGVAPTPNGILATPASDDAQTFASTLLTDPDVRAVIATADAKESLRRATDALQMVVIILIILACALAFVVLYNLTNINIMERIRELATIKVLGFFDSEVAMYIYRENIIVTVLGIGLGLIGGIFLHRFVLWAVEINILMFPKIIKPQSYLYSVLFAAVFAVIVNLVMNRRIAAIDMVESLKSVE